MSHFQEISDRDHKSKAKSTAKLIPILLCARSSEKLKEEYCASSKIIFLSRFEFFTWDFYMLLSSWTNIPHFFTMAWMNRDTQSHCPRTRENLCEIVLQRLREYPGVQASALPQISAIMRASILRASWSAHAARKNATRCLITLYRTFCSCIKFTQTAIAIWMP